MIAEKAWKWIYRCLDNQKFTSSRDGEMYYIIFQLATSSIEL